MTFALCVVAAAGLLALCLVWLLLHRGAPPIPNPERAPLTGARTAVHAERDRLDRVLPAGRARDDTPWKAHVRLVETELASGHVDAAVGAWQDAYAAALASRSWESIPALGDAFMRIGYAAGTPGRARMNARDAYFAALIRARRGYSVDGALRSADAFAELGDGAVVAQGLYIAAQLAAGDEQAQKWVSEARQHWAGMHTAAGA
jgi:hypothetical protein